MNSYNFILIIWMLLNSCSQDEIIIMKSCQSNNVEPIQEPYIIELNEYLEGIECARNQDKLVLLYFFGYGCTSYDEFMEDFLPSKKIREKINSDFVFVKLYVDDPEKLDQTWREKLEQIGLSEEAINKIRNVGNMNQAIQIEKFKSNSQPFYVIMTPDEKLLTEPFGYTGKNQKLFLYKLDEVLTK